MLRVQTLVCFCPANAANLVKSERETYDTEISKTFISFNLFDLCSGILFRCFGSNPKFNSAKTTLFCQSQTDYQSADGKTTENAVMEVSGGKIIKIEKSANFKIPTDAQVFDYSDKFIIPGLIDTHAHLYTNLTFGHSTNPALPPLFIAGGVTSIIVPGSGDPEGDIALKNRVDSGRVVGPRMFVAGEYIDMEPLNVPWMEAAKSETEAKAKLDMWFSRGATAVKVYTGMRGEMLRTVINYAHQRGFKVNGHLERETWGKAIEMGIDVLHHGIYSFPEIMPKDIPAQAIGMINFAPPEYEKFYQAIVEAEFQIATNPSRFQSRRRSKSRFCTTVVALEPPDATKYFMSAQQPFYAPDAWKRVEQRFNAEKKKYALLLTNKNVDFVREAHKAGAMLSTGTDMTNLQMLPAFSLYREMEIFGEAGMKPMEVLKAATYNGAYAIGRSDLIGSLEVGKAADFVVLNANPLENIGNVRQVFRVSKNGTIYVPEEVTKSLKGRIH
jgi:imidazolonepropionase-like amidohydrolase